MSLATRLAALELTLDDLYDRRRSVAAELKLIELGVKGYAPTASGAGINLDHDGHVDRLHRELESLEKRILAARIEIDELTEDGDLGTLETQAF